MALSNSERQAAFRKRKAATHKKLELLIPAHELAIFQVKAKELGITQAELFSQFIQSNTNLYKQDEKLPDNKILLADNDSLHKDLSILTKLNKQLKNEIAELKGLGDTAKKAAKKGREKYPYDNHSLDEDIVEWRKSNGKKTSIKSTKLLADLKRPAKKALGLGNGKCTDKQNRAIFEWIKENKQ